MLLTTLLIVQLALGACKAQPTQAVQREPAAVQSQWNTVHSTLAILNAYSLLAKRSVEYICQRRTLAVNLEGDFAAQSARAHMLDDNTVEVEMWVYRPMRDALENALPTPTPIPDRFAPEYLPTDYEVRLFDLVTARSKYVKQTAVPFQADLCDACEQRLLSQSPDDKWQLIIVTQARLASLNGIWLTNNAHFRRLVAPFESASFYRPSQTWWDWQSDSSGLYLSYWTAGERPEVPLYIDLTRPPAYHFLLEGLHLGSGLFSNRSIAVSDTTILLNVSGPVILEDGSSTAQQWYIFDVPNGNLRQATSLDFSQLVKFLLVSSTKPRLIRWNEQRQRHWLVEHPSEDIWNQLGDSALFTEPYRTATGIVRIPLITNTRDPFQVIDCAPRPSTN